jgi:hypothetical protein
MFHRGNSEEISSVALLSPACLLLFFPSLCQIEYFSMRVPQPEMAVMLVMLVMLLTILMSVLYPQYSLLQSI